MIVLPMKNCIQGYDWGHGGFIRNLILSGGDATFQSVSGAVPVPQAELWMGTHPAAPSQVWLDDAWQDLSQACFSQMAPSHKAMVALPFLVKILAVEHALSIQCHPSREQAAAGFRLEELQGINRSAANRNYKDDNHKPEVLCALGDFYGLCGFRSGEDVCAELGRILALMDDSDAALLLRQYRELAFNNDWRTLVGRILNMEATLKADILQAVFHYAQQASGKRYELLLKTAQYYPHDSGLLFFVVLEFFHLRPGEALFIPAGVLHAYLEGNGVEVMASSDNVLRGGLTHKHIDPTELVRILNTDSGAMQVQALQMVPGYAYRYLLPVKDFVCERYMLSGNVCLDLCGTENPELFVCTAGCAHLAWEHDDGTRHLHTIQAGRSVFVPAHRDSFSVAGDGQLFRVSLP